MSIKFITPAEVFRLQQESGGIKIIDVRERDEFSVCRSPLSINFPLSKLDPREVAKSCNSESSVFIICKSGRRSLQAAEILANSGFKSVHNITGGMLDWEAAGLPTVRSNNVF